MRVSESACLTTPPLLLVLLVSREGKGSVGRLAHTSISCDKISKVFIFMASIRIFMARQQFNCNGNKQFNANQIASVRVLVWP